MSSKTEAGGATAALLLGAILIVATVLRFVGLGSGLWFDEIVTLVQSARLPFLQILTDFPALNVHPLYSLLAHASLQIFGESAWALRLPACIFGIGSVALTYVLALRVSSWTEACIATALLATSYHHIWFSQNARGYTVMSFLTVLSTLALLRAIERGRPGYYVLYAIACAAGVYTHLTTVFVVAGHAAALLIAVVFGWRPADDRGIPRLCWTFAGAALLSVLLYAPFIPSVLMLMNAAAPKQAAQVATPGWALNEAIRTLRSTSGLVAALAATLVAILGGLSILRMTPLVFGLLVLPAVATGIGIVGLGQPIRPRFFFFLSSAAAIFAARGVRQGVSWLVSRELLPSRRLEMGVAVVGLALVAAAAMALPENYRRPKQDYEGAIRFLDAEASRGAAIAAAGPACLPLHDYYGKGWKCLQTLDEWTAFRRAQARGLLVYTLADYMSDRALQSAVLAQCPVIQRFRGTLGGGDLIVCDPGAEPESR